jgi:hypothetical protein
MWRPRSESWLARIWEGAVGADVLYMCQVNLVVASHGMSCVQGVPGKGMASFRCPLAERIPPGVQWAGTEA